jgi:hypothetical protein
MHHLRQSYLTYLLYVMIIEACFQNLSVPFEYQKYYYRMRLSEVVHIVLIISIIRAELSAAVQHEEPLLIML